MALKSIQDVIKSVDQPSRYAGSEVNAIIKNHAQTDLKMVLAFPDLYEIGTSHFGIQILYHILNKNPQIVAERVYTPAPDMEKELRENKIPMFSRETKTPLIDFDIIGFSLLYELNYTNVLTLLDLAGIPFLSNQRDDRHPLIIAGGPCTFNPEPVADLFDAMVIGDGEDVILTLSQTYMDWKKSGGDKQDLLKKWSNIQGIYIPSFFKPEYSDENGISIQSLHPVYYDYNQVKRAIIPDLETAEFPDSPVIPCGRPIHERLRLEISRGCSRGCRFCQAGMIYRPVRERNTDTLLDLTGKAVCNTGHEDLSLLSLSAGDYVNLNTLMLKLMDASEQQKYTSGHLSFSLPSIRAGKLNSEMMETIKRVRKTGFTIAPEAGSQRLRDVINKGINEEEIITTVQSAFDLGWTVIKLYFMIGLPTETMDDLEQMVELVKRLSRITQSKGRKRQINVSVSTFIPKSHSPFQWEKQISEQEAWEKILWLKDKLNLKNVNFKWGKTQISFLEGLMSRGDRRVTPVIIRAYQKGCRLDGWNEYFKYDMWKEAILEEQIDPSIFSNRTRPSNERLPWDHIDSGIKKDFLLKEYERSLQGLLTEDCRDGNCSGCGICDFESIKPRIETKIHYEPIEITENITPIKEYKKIKCRFKKVGDARFYGHLEMVNTFSKAIRRACIPVKYTSGHHKIIKIVFSNPIPVGYESLDEFFSIDVHDDFDTNRIMNELNHQLPAGLNIFEAIVVRHKNDIIEKPNILFSVIMENYNFSQTYIENFLKKDHVPYEKTNKKGIVKTLNLKEFVHSLTKEAPDKINFEIHSLHGVNIRPEDVVKSIFNISDEDIKKADIFKLKHFS